jgi:hypothetical protein
MLINIFTGANGGLNTLEEINENALALPFRSFYKHYNRSR